MLCRGYLIIVNGQNIKKSKKNRKFPILSCRTWETASAVCAHMRCHSTAYKQHCWVCRRPMVLATWA